MPYKIIEKLMENGADIKKKYPLSFAKHDEYPLSFALVNKLPLPYVQLFYHSDIPPIHIIGVMNIIKPSTEIVSLKR